MVLAESGAAVSCSHIGRCLLRFPGVTPSLLDAALAYASAGWFVIPLDGKVPLTEHGKDDASRDESVIRAWWAAWPEANVGGVMGKPFAGGFLVAIDVDPRNGGWRSFDALEANGCTFPETREHDSGGVHEGEYGRHLFYLSDEPFGDGKIAVGIDVKGVGYVVLPPSVHPESGEAYELAEDRPIAKLPAWIAVQKLAAQRPAGVVPEPIDLETEEGQRRLLLGEEAAKTFAPSCADGEGGTRLLSLCLRLVRGLELPLDAAQGLIEAHFNPRCTTPDGTHYPWSDREIRHKLEDAANRSDLPVGILTEATESGIKALAERLGNRNRTVIAPATKSKTKSRADDAYSGERVKVTRADLIQMLYKWPDWDGVLWEDVLARKTYVTDPPIEGRMTLTDGELSNGDLALIAHWLDVHGFLASKDLIKDAIESVVRSPDRQRNLIAEYFDSLPEVEGVSVLPTLATDVFHCTDPQANVYLMKTLVAAARRARNPGTFHKAMLVLKGDQQCGKTPAVKILAGDWYYTTGNGNLADRDTILECQGKSLVEVEELSALNKADADALKTAISRTHDVITKKYEADGRTYPRSFVLIGTTNKDEFLTDATGNARYWVVECGQIDLARLDELRDVIWAEADFLAKAGYSNELDVSERKELDERNKSFLNTHPWLDEVARYLGGKPEVGSATEVLLHIMKGDTAKVGTREKNAVADLMRTLGCKNVRVWRDGKTVRLWTVPEGLPKKPPAKVVALRPAGR